MPGWAVGVDSGGPRPSSCREGRGPRSGRSDRFAKYLLLIYTDEASLPATPEAFAAMAAEYGAYTDAIAAQGILRHGEALPPTSAATTVRVRDGRTLIIDGPFAETKEALGGFYLVDCEDLDGAVAAAAGIPGARLGTVEVRPIQPMPEPGAAV